jgi:hypothetical protein
VPYDAAPRTFSELLLDDTQHLRVSDGEDDAEIVPRPSPRPRFHSEAFER